jgi:hypothetical protein
MSNHLFHPRRIDVPPRLLLVPRWLDPALEADVRRCCRVSRPLWGATLFHFPGYAVLSGFFGYPHLLTLLESIAGLQNKEIALLGSAGALDPRLEPPQVVEVARCAGYGPLARFCRRSPLLSAESPVAAGEKVVAVTVDLLQRETPAFLKRAERHGWQVVEMELFPLLAVLERPPSATLVLTDRVTQGGIVPCADRREIKGLFHERFVDFQKRWHDETGGDPGPSVFAVRQ